MQPISFILLCTQLLMVPAERIRNGGRTASRESKTTEAQESRLAKINTLNNL